MRFPALLNKGTLAEVSRIQCESLSITLSETPTHAVSMRICDPSIDIGVGDWIRVFTPQDTDFVAVITQIESDPITDVRTVNGEHVYRLLEDQLIIGDVNPGGTSGGSPKKCTPATAIETAMAYNSLWTLSEVIGFSDTLPYSFKSESVRSAVDSVLDTLEDYQLEFNTNVCPFRLTVKKRPSDTVSEMRLNRNISTMRVSVDKTDMWNRFYPIGNKDIMLDDYSVEDFQSINAWGLVEHTETINSISDKDTLRAYAEAQLKKYSQPQVTVTISGFDYADSTGESMDRLRIGTMCRVPLPKQGVTYTQRITKLAWNDALHAPEAVTVTLCNVRQNVKRLSDSVKQNTRRSRSLSKSVSSVAKTTANALNGFAGDLSSAWTAIEQNQSQIILAAQVLTGNNTLTSTITVTGGGILSQVSNLSTISASHTSQIEQLATSINLKADTVTVDAQIANINAAITNLGNIVNGGVIQASSVTTNGLGVNGAFYYHEERVTPTQITSTSRERYSVLGIV